MRDLFRLSITALAFASALAAGARQTTVALQPGWMVDTWTVDDGLPTNLISDLAIAADGSLWISTFDGLARLDAGGIRVFKRTEWPILSSNRFTTLHRAEDGRLWILEENGQLLTWDGRQFLGWLAPGELPGRSRRIEPSGGRLWLLTDGGLVELTGGEPVRRFAETVGRAVRDVVTDDLGRLWLATEGQVFVVEGGVASPVPGAPTSVLDLAVWEGQVWAFAEPADVWRWTGDRFEAVPVSSEAAAPSDSVGAARGVDNRPLRPPSRRAFEVTADGDLRLIGSAGSWLLGAAGFEAEASAPAGGWPNLQKTPDGAVWSWSQVEIRRDGVPLVAGRRLRGLVADPEGSVWFSDLFRGISRLSKAAALQVRLADGLPAQWVTLAWDGSLWTGDDLGRLFATVPGSGGQPELIRQLLPDAADRPIWSAGRASGGRMLVGGTGWVGELQEGGLRPLAEPLAESAGRVRLIHESPDGSLWISSDDGVRVGAPGQPWRARLAPGGEPILTARAFVDESDGSVLVASNGQGLIRLGRDGSAAALTRRHGLSSDRLRDVLRVAEGIAWVATEDSGLCRIVWPSAAARPSDVRCLTEADGLHDDALHSVALDDEERLWLSSNRGIFVIAAAQLDAWGRGQRTGVEPLVIDQRHGMLDREANGNFRPAMARDRDGRLWYPTMGGLVGIDPAEVRPPLPRLHFDQLRIGDELRRVPASGRLVLSSLERDLSVSWLSPIGYWGDQVRYRYRLVGYDSRWRGPTAENRASWTNLPAGDLLVEVEAGLGGTWAPAALRLEVHRTPGFRETLAFRLLLAAVVFLAAGLGIAVWARAQRLRRVELERLIAERTGALEEQAAELASANQRILGQNARLAELDQLKNRFVANVSHELRTPLTLVHGALADMAEARPCGEDDGRLLRRARRNSERLGLLVDQLMDIASLDAGKVRLRARRLDLVGFARSIADRFAGEAARRGIELVTPAAAAQRVYFDPDALDKVLGNLLGNAFKFTPDGGRVIVAAPPATDELVSLEVSDNGIGIPEQHQDRLFERLYQVDGQDRRRYEGVGIGLSLAAELVELHGGTLAVASRPGVGSTFRVSLPRGVDHLAPDDVECGGEAAARPFEAWAAEAPAPRVASGCGPLVLVVEDHPDMRAYLVEHLSRRWRILEAADGAEALRLIARQRPAAVVSDVMMPGTDGLEMCRRIRADANLRDLPVMLVSAKGTGQDRTDGLELADDYVTKPFFMPELMARVARLVRGAGDDTGSGDPEPPLAQVDLIWLERLDTAATAGIEAPAFNVEALARAMAMSPRQLQREIKRLNQQSPVEYLREIRLTRARKLIERRSHTTVAEVAAAVGLSPSYLTRLYRARLGRLPSADLSSRP